MMSRRGQSTVEFAIMIPVIFAALFLIVELAFFFGSTHYVNYAAFTAARAQQVGESATDATDLLLDGNVTAGASVSASTGAGSVKIAMPWEMDLPFTSGFGAFDYEVTVIAGPEEARYEGTTGNRSTRYGDNQCGRGC
ncbi:MAG: pilus assembly protein [Pseudomonadota bacterium]|nr:pilus assembly protein [Pseudomonadota bacterium]